MLGKIIFAIGISVPIGLIVYWVYTLTIVLRDAFVLFARLG